MPDFKIPVAPPRELGSSNRVGVFDILNRRRSFDADRFSATPWRRLPSAGPVSVMQVTSEGKDRLVVTHDSSGWTRVLLGLALILFAAAGWRYYDDGGNSEQFGGSLGGAFTCLLMAALLFERSHVAVDARTRIVHWRRRRVFGATRGSFVFGDVKNVLAERPLGDDGVMRRVVFHTRQGSVPITLGFLPDANDCALGLALKLRMMLGLAIEEEPVPSAVQSLVAGGREIEAIKTLREARGISLTEAHSAVKALRPTGHKR